MSPLITVLGKLRRRIAFLLWLNHLVNATLIAIAAACLWLLATRLFPRLGDPHWASIALLVLGLGVATIWGVIKRPSLLGAALATDDRLGLQERLTSSYELAQTPGPMVAALHEDAARFSAQVNPADAFPLGLPRRARWLAIPLLVYGLTFAFMPELDLLGYREEQRKIARKMEVRRVHAERIRNIARPLREDNEDSIAEAQDMTTELDRLAEDLLAGEITEKQAAARLTGLAEDLMEERSKLTAQLPVPDPSGFSMESGAMAEVAKDMEQGDYGEAASKLEEMMEELASGGLSGEKAKQVAADLKKLAEMAGGEDSALGQALAKAAAAAEAAAEAGDTAAMEAMELAMADAVSVLQQLGKMEQAMGQMGMAQAELMGEAIMGQLAGRGPGRVWTEGSGGLGGPGRGRGNRIGNLPDTGGAFEESMLSGEMGPGKVLAGIMQRTAPEGETESMTTVATDAIISAQQEAEQALTREEIPPGAKGFVQQYFGSLEPERRRAAPAQTTADPAE